MSAVVDRIPCCHPTDADLPFGPADPAPADPAADLDDPIYVGGVDIGQRGVFGPIHLELMLLDRGRIELGPYVLPKQQAQRLVRLLNLAIAVLGEHSPTRPVPRPESGRGIAGWDLARNLTGLAAAGCPWEGETLP